MTKKSREFEFIVNVPPNDETLARAYKVIVQAFIDIIRNKKIIYGY